MAERLHQIGAAIPLLTAIVSRLEAFVFDKKQIPEPQGLADVEWKRQPGFRRSMTDRGDLVHEIIVELANVLVADRRKRRIRHRRVQIMAVPGNPVSNGAAEIFQGILADAVVRIRRDVGRINNAERRIDRTASGKRSLRRIGGMAGVTVRRSGQVSPPAERLGLRGLCRRQPRKEGRAKAD